MRAWTIRFFLVAMTASSSVLLSSQSAKEDEKDKRPKPAQATNSIGMKLALIPAGEFMMGSHESSEDLNTAFPAYKRKEKIPLFEDEKPRHKVRITKPFYLGIHEVTIGQFRQFVKDTDFKTESERDPKRGLGGWGVNLKTGKFEGRRPEYSWRNTGFPQTDAHPVVNVTWADAVAFCDWLSRKEKKTYRLPTEAEWEYACRAGTTTRYASGDDPETLVKVANIADATGKKQGLTQFPDWGTFALKGEDGHVFTAPVGSYQPNQFGLYDMHGNVWEWCSDVHDEDYYRNSPEADPKGPEKGTYRSRRGGAWHTYPLYVRSAFRNWNRQDTRYLNLGFRVAQTK